MDRLVARCRLDRFVNLLHPVASSLVQQICLGIGLQTCTKTPAENQTEMAGTCREKSLCWRCKLFFKPSRLFSLVSLPHIDHDDVEHEWLTM